MDSRQDPSRADSTRRYLNPRTFGLTLVALLLVAAMVALGRWQYGVYDNSQRADAVARLHEAPRPLAELLGPDSAFPPEGVGVPVTVSGRYDRVGQLYVQDYAGMQGGYAVVTPLVTPIGSAILVIRGSAPAIGDAVPPGGPVTVTGVLEPSDSAGHPLDEARVTDGVNIAALVSGIPQDLYDGYVVATASTPPSDLPAVAPPLPDASRWAGIRNLLYALQWWCFAGFVAFLWWRIVNDLAREPSRAVR